MPSKIPIDDQAHYGVGGRDWRIAFALITLVPIFLFLMCTRAPAIYDSGYPLSLALRVIAGDIPHRDFYTQYGPAQIYIFAAMFRLFGVNLLPIVIFEMITRGFTAAVLYLFLRSFCKVRTALGAIAVVTLILGTFGYPVASYEILPPVFACAWLSTKTFKGPVSISYSLLYGCLCALATLFRYEQGIMLLVLYGSVLALAKWRSAGWSSVPMGQVVAPFLVACVTFIALAGSWITFLYRHDALRDWVYQCFVFPRQYYVAARHLPLPQLSLHHTSSEVIYLVFLTIGLSSIVLIKLCLRPKPTVNKELGALAFLTLLGLSYAFKASVRIDLAQLAPATIVVVCLTAIVFQRNSSRMRPLGMSVVALGVACSAFSILSFLSYVVTLKKEQHLALQHMVNSVNAKENQWCKAASPLTRGFCFVIDQNHHDLISYLSQHIGPGAPLYVGVPRHDHIFASDNLLYFALNAVPAVRWSNFDPDLQTRPDIQCDMIRSLSTAQPRYLVETSQFDDVHESNDSSAYTQVFLLDNFIASHYHVSQRFGDLLLFEQNAPSLQR